MRLKNPFRRVELSGSVKVDEVYGSRWGTISVNTINSNGGLCCHCLWRRATICHHMFYIPRWKVWWMERVRKAGPVEINKKLGNKYRRIWNREIPVLHVVGVCRHCHRHSVEGSVHSKDAWVQYPGMKLLNHNTWQMRWRLRAGWLVTWLITLPFRLFFWVLYKLMS